MTHPERDHRRKEKFHILVILMALFSLHFEQGVSHFRFALGPAN